MAEMKSIVDTKRPIEVDNNFDWKRWIQTQILINMGKAVAQDNLNLKKFNDLKFNDYQKYVDNLGQGENSDIKSGNNSQEYSIVLPFEDLLQLPNLRDSVGNKNTNCAILNGDLEAGEGIDRVPGVTLPGELYTEFLYYNNLITPITTILGSCYRDEITNSEAEKLIQELKVNVVAQPSLKASLRDSYEYLKPVITNTNGTIEPVIVRSSFTFKSPFIGLQEDSADNAGAGRYSSIANNFSLEELEKNTIEVYFSTFTERAIADFRGSDENGVPGKGKGLKEKDGSFSHLRGMMSCPVMKQVRSDLAGGGSAVIFTTARGLININIANLFGEELVRGDVQGYEVEIYGPWLDDLNQTGILNEKLNDLKVKPATLKEILNISREAWRLHKKHGTDKMGVDLEVAFSPLKEGQEYRKASFVQFRPNVKDDSMSGMKIDYELTQKPTTQPVIIGCPGNQKIASGIVRYVADGMKNIQLGDLVIIPSAMPEWNGVYEKEPSGVIAMSGGLGSHFTVENKSKKPALVVGAEGFNLKAGSEATIVNQGTKTYIYPEKLPYKTTETPLDPLLLALEHKTQAYLIQSDPTITFEEQIVKSTAEQFSKAIALVRPETMLSTLGLQHPDAYLMYDRLADQNIKEIVRLQLVEWNGENTNPINPAEYYNLMMANGFSRIAAAANGGDVYVRAPEIRTDEHPPVLVYEIDEKGNFILDENGNIKTKLSQKTYNNPMIAGHGAPVYHSEHEHILNSYIESLKIARNQVGAINIVPFMPFISREFEIIYLCNKLKENGFKPPYAAMIEVPSIIELIPILAKYGFTKLSIGLNDLTQMLFGQDRDTMSSYPIDWQNPTLISTLKRIIWLAKTNGCTIGFCGQLNTKDGDQNKLAKILYDLGIDYMAANPDNITELNETLFDFNRELTLLDNIKSLALQLAYKERNIKNNLFLQLEKLKNKITV